MKKISLFVVLIALIASCSIVEVDEQASAGPNDTPEVETPDESDINLGSQTVPADSATAAIALHGEVSKTWQAEEFIIEGGGFTMELSCRLDDTIILNADGTLTYESGQWSCGGEEGEATDRTGNFAITNMDPNDFRVSFSGITGFDESTFEGEVWTLEENVLVISGTYESGIFGNFTVTGRYVSQ